MGYLFRLPSKKLDMIIYYERYVVIQTRYRQNTEGEPLQNDFLTEEEHLDIMDELLKTICTLKIAIQINSSLRWGSRGFDRLRAYRFRCTFLRVTPQSQYRNSSNAQKRGIKAFKML
ncbi:MAG: hypothetical protein CM15mP62_10350 [Rhodospirillaceae bacterium]|nr:MAG: hypothetical protein CM15mP62_10350 [Rhodospirillaceae bacterium]